MRLLPTAHLVTVGLSGALWRRRRGKVPVFGVEIAVSPSETAKRPLFDYWFILFDDRGFKAVEPSYLFGL